MRQLADFVRCSVGWRRMLIAVLSGAASVLAMAPFFAWPVLFLTLPVLVWLLDAGALGAPAVPPQRWWRRPVARAATAGWCFGFGYFFAGLFWIGEAFLVEAGKFAVLMPFAVCLLPAALAMFWATAAAAAFLPWRPGLSRIIALAIALSAAEWLRGHVFTGLPWNVLGYALTWPLPLMQAAALLGIYGLTFVAIVVLASPLVLWVDAREGRIGRAWQAWGALIAVAPLLVLAVWGYIRLAAPEPPANTTVMVRLVQPSVPQRQKWRPEYQQQIFREHLELSTRSPAGAADGAAGIAFIVWPEAAMPFLPLREPEALAAIGRMLPDGAYLAAGALRVDETAESGGPPRWRAYNSLMVFADSGQPISIYDKIHLVPFGEYLPFQPVLEAIGLEQLTRRRGGFSTGAVPRPLLSIPGLPPAGPLICYEAIFPGEIVQGVERPAFLLNVTNDGWFGNTIGPHQHLHQARVRAVEQGLPLLRAANNGISAVIDAKGRVPHRLDLDVKGVIDAALPAAIAPPPYAAYGDWLFALMLAAACVILGAYNRARKPKP
jgi:apolipoprotein N-acyltransferase